MRSVLLCALSCLASARSIADVTLRTCSGSAPEHASVVLDDSGAYHVTLTLGKQTFRSSTCKSLTPTALGVSGIECLGDWSQGEGGVLLDSMDGLLNVLMYKGPRPLPAQYDEERALYCGAPAGQRAANGQPQRWSN